MRWRLVLLVAAGYVLWRVWKVREALAPKPPLMKATWTEAAMAVVKSPKLLAPNG